MRGERVAPRWKMPTVERLCKADERAQQGLPRRALPRGLATRVAEASARATRRAQSTAGRTKNATGNACAHKRASAFGRAFLACAPFAATACAPLRPGPGPGARAGRATAAHAVFQQLRTRNAANLAAKMKEVNDEKKLSQASPSESQVEEFINQAGAMEPLITH